MAGGGWRRGSRAVAPRGRLDCRQPVRIVAGTLPLEEAIDFALDTGSSGVSASVRAGVGRTADLGPLTSREREICELVAEGLSNKEIAARLVISPRTAESHVQNVMGKLGFTRRTQITAWMAEQQGDGPRPRPGTSAAR